MVETEGAIHFTNYINGLQAGRSLTLGLTLVDIEWWTQNESNIPPRLRQSRALPMSYASELLVSADGFEPPTNCV
jgi:hypothetical protein